jgi:hypothetical protein
VTEDGLVGRRVRRVTKLNQHAFIRPTNSFIGNGCSRRNALMRSVDNTPELRAISPRASQHHHESDPQRVLTSGLSCVSVGSSRGRFVVVRRERRVRPINTSYAAMARSMDDSERIVLQYLQNQDLGDIVYEPDGNVPPDFLVNGRIAVEVRRLNENVETDEGHRGLEEISKPLNVLVRKALAAPGPPIHGTSWFVFYTYSRPLPAWRELDVLLRRTLGEVAGQPNLEDHELRVANKMCLHFTRASEVHPHLFILGGSADHDAGGFVVAELADNLRLCIDEKSAKVQKVRNRYPEWWLVFEDRIAYGALGNEDQEQLRQLIRRDGRWNKIILVNPLNPSTGFEL